MASFEKALAYIKPNEGGFTDNKDDPGGRTNFGITQKTLNSYSKAGVNLPLDVKDLTWEQAEMIFKDEYGHFDDI